MGTKKIEHGHEYGHESDRYQNPLANFLFMGENLTFEEFDAYLLNEAERCQSADSPQ
ncbi:MAG: hypothetical protein GY862_34900 [Gammaproteobacteria bacterium]|nr:hypothetical protein [Gammaproteobacteria bacterium]